MTREDEIERLRAENAALRAKIARFEQRIAGLEAPPTPPAWVKPNRPKRAAPPPVRKPRAAHHNGARKRDVATQAVVHALEHCPSCQMRLSGSSVARRRQVIDLPPPASVEVTEHVVYKRWCPQCTKWRTPHLDLTDQVVSPQGRIGVRLASVIVYERTVLRLPVRQIQADLTDRYGCTLSVGESVAVTQQVAERAKPVVATFKQAALRSAQLHADETPWREQGQNGSIWGVSTPGENGVRLYEYDPSRARGVVQRSFNGQFQGCLVSDVSAGYTMYAGKHQRCWVHLLRDLHELKQAHPDDAAVQQWATTVRGLYDTAKAHLAGPAPPSQTEREGLYVRLVSEAHRLGLQYAQCLAHACCALAKRLLRHEEELFQCVLVAGLAADTTLAERSLRPVVVVRTISGGSRSRKGTETRMTLASLFGTWRVRTLDPFVQCLALLSQHCPSP